MQFFENLKEFFSVAKQTNFNLAQIFEQTPNGTYSAAAVLAVILLIIVFLIIRAVKVSSAVKLVSQIQDVKDYEDYNSKLTKLATELPKRGKKVADSINLQKDEILKKELELLKDFNIKDKIDKYKQISSQYALISQNSKKYKMDDLTSYYDEKSKSLLDENLSQEIKEYYDNANFDENDVEYVNSIVSYANTTSNPEAILNPLNEQINRFSYTHNLDLFKFVMSLTKTDSNQVYTNCTQKLNEVLKSEESNVSEVILNYMLENDLKDDVYNYISNLTNKTHLQSLYNNMFGKTENVELDLAFVSNETKIDDDYANYLDCKLTNNWRDLGLIKKIMDAPRVLDNIGHISYRNVLERIERLENEEENNKAISEALEVARRAEAIAQEAKELARQR